MESKILRLMGQFIPPILKPTIRRIIRRKPIVESVPSKSIDTTGMFEGIKAENYAEFGLKPHTIPLPTEALMGTVSNGNPKYFFALGESFAHLVSAYLPNNPIVLDIGCGCGKVARFLYLNPNLRYIGFDLFKPSIDWCKQAFKHVGDTRFRFEHFDGYSTVWNPAGKIKSTEYRFPVNDNEVNFVIAFSLFTHLFEDESKHFLAELNRVLAPNGLAIISIIDDPEKGTKYSGDHSRTCIEFEYFLKLAAEQKLQLKEDFGDFWGQRTLLFELKKRLR